MLAPKKSKPALAWQCLLLCKPFVPACLHPIDSDILSGAFVLLVIVVFWEGYNMKRGMTALAIVAFAVTVMICGCSIWQGPTQSDSSSEPKAESSSSASSDHSDSSYSSANSVSSSSSSSQTDTSSKIDVASDSILAFDNNENSAKLIEDMAAGRTPAECTVLYDQMGALPSVTVKDSKTIQQVYEALAKVTVVGETQYSMTDNYHSVSFKLQDGTSMGFNFEGEAILARGKTNYAIMNAGPLWALIRSLQAEKVGGERFYAITLDDPNMIVVDCPSTAQAGDRVRVICLSVLDADVAITVNGNNLGRFVEEYKGVGPAYEFVMPDSDVEVQVRTDSSWYGPNGAGS